MHQHPCPPTRYAYLEFRSPGSRSRGTTMSVVDVARCGARTRTGQACVQPRMLPAGRCRLHGGRTPRGLANANTVSGRYSKDLPTRVLGRYEAALADPELLSVRDDIAFLQGAITDLMAELKEA